ncbi:MAG: carboxypeptidase regulatory-like domain-containing protein [Flavitalea sp.]
MKISRIIGIVFLGVVIMGGLSAFKGNYAGSIRGTVVPADAANRAWAISPTDTLKASVLQGAYQITNVKQGAYRIIIEAKPPYKNVARDSIRVMDGQSTEVGEIRIDQK